MIIYLDVLLFINFFIDLLLIKLTLKLCNKSVSNKIMIASSLLCSLFSLYIFLPQVGIAVDLLFRTLPAMCVALICNKFKLNSMFFRLIFYFYIISFIFAGSMLGIWVLFKPHKMAVNNGIVYFNISPLLLIAFSLLFYILITVLQRFSKKDLLKADRYDVSLKFESFEVKKHAMVDTGFGLKDILTDKVVVIIDITVARELFGFENTELLINLKTPENENLKTRIRFIQIKTVSGIELMPAVRIDALDVSNGIEILEPIVVISKNELFDDFNVILPADIF